MFASPVPWPIVSASEEDRGLATIGPPDRAVQPDADTWIARLGELPLVAQPGARWLYNTGASVLGVLVARAAGQPFDEVLRTRVFEPLGMVDTAYWTSQTHRLATAYQPTAGGLVARDQPDGLWSRPPAFLDGAAGLLSTVDDLHAFARMLLRGGAPVLPADSVRAMTIDQLADAQKAHGGLSPHFFEGSSWSYCQMVYGGGAFGWNGGSGCSWRVDPSSQLTVIVLTQRALESPELPQVHRDIQAATYAALG